MSEYLRIYRPQLLKYCAAPSLLALLLLFAAFLYTKPSAPYRQHGVETHAIVKDISPRPNLKAELTYYFLFNSQAREYKRVVASEWKLMADTRRDIPVTYLPENPDLHMIGAIQDIQREDAPADYMRFAALLLGLGAIEKRPKVVAGVDGDDVIAVRTCAYFSLSFDHKLVDGADADRFMADVKRTLETVPDRGF